MTQHTYEAPPTVAERADDEIYANAVNALAAVLRFDIEDSTQAGRNPAQQFAIVLRKVALEAQHGGAGTYLADVFDQFGPGAVLLALKRAYEQPQPSAPLVGD